MTKLRRRKGATLGMVAVLVLAILIIGIAFFLLAKMMGGGRELAGATDAGTVNISKVALLKPSKLAKDFSNPDVASNFEGLGDDGSLCLANYNRLVAQSIIVALNAKDEGTSLAGRNAEKVWRALNDVGQFLRQNHENTNVMGGYFLNIAGANNLKMMGKNKVGISDYAISFMKRGGSTNVFVNPILQSTFNAAGQIPTNSSGRSSPTGNKYLAGYTPLSVAVPSGNTLVLTGVTVCPQDRPHLVNLGEFNNLSGDDFIAGSGSPAYPADTLPPNTFKASAINEDSTSGKLGGAVACAIVGSLNREYEAQIPRGYIIVRNGPSAAGPSGGLAATGGDIFSHSLSKPGISTNDSGWFCHEYARAGSVGEPKANDAIETAALAIANSNNLFTQMAGTNLVNQWALRSRIVRLAGPLGGVLDHVLTAADVPSCSFSQLHVRKPDGSVPTCDDLKSITELTSYNCDWHGYRDTMQEPRCLEKLPIFKRGWGEFGSTEGNFQNNGYTCIEQYKCDVMAARVNCTNCATVATPAPTGMKYFIQGASYPAPKGYYNFGVVKTPYDYLRMIDLPSGANGCATGQTIDTLLKRCQQMSTAVTRERLIEVLSSHELSLGQSLYLCLNGGGSLVMSDSPPSWMVSTRPDGTVPTPGGTSGCGSMYQVMGTAVNTYAARRGGNSLSDFGGPDFSDDTDGRFPGWAWRDGPQSSCQDQALWTPSTGYNNLLGELNFYNSCIGGGTFCQPN